MGSIKLPHASGNSMSIAAPATNPASDLELKLPATIGTANQFLKNSGTAGELEYATATESSGNFAINSGYGSVATTFGVRAWVTFEGDSGSGDDVSVTVSGSGGVTSVTRVSSGIFQVNLSFTMPDTNYSWTAVARRDNTVANAFDVVSWWPNDAKNTTNFRLRTFYVAGTDGVGTHNGRVVQVIVVR